MSPSAKHLVGHSVEMVVAMFPGMAVGPTAVERVTA